MCKCILHAVPCKACFNNFAVPGLLVMAESEQDHLPRKVGEFNEGQENEAS